MKTAIRVGAVATMAAFALAACSSAPDNSAAPTTPNTSGPVTSAPVEPVDYKACMVSDQGGFDDKSFNQAGYEGLQEVARDLGLDTATAESQDSAEYNDNLGTLVAADCDLIVTVGFLLGDATADAAAANPNAHFAIIDFAYDEPIDNVKPLIFDTDEAAFLAGYAAADVSKTGVVATYGGVQIPTVTIFMDGFLKGVNYYNEVNGTSVSVLGWDGTNGSFTNDFEDLTKGKALTEGFLQQGADVILPVAGPVGQGSGAAIRESGANAWIVGVDSDWFVTTPEYSDLVFTSIMKLMGPAVYDVVEQAATGAGFSNEPYVGTLENGGIGLAELRNAEYSADLVAKLEEIKQGIIDGTISVN